MNNSLLDNNIKSALKMIPSPTALVGAKRDEIHDVATVSWFIQESVNPPQITLNIAKDRYIYGLIDDTRELMLSVLPDGSEQIADVCGNTSGKYTDKVKELGLHTSEASQIHVPRINEAISNIECRVVNMVDAGDHTMIIGEVLAANYVQGKAPLVCYQGEYAHLQV